jgi:hypothetical protein
MKDHLTTDCADSERLKELQRVGDPPPLRHAVILILKKTKLAGFPTLKPCPRLRTLPIPSARWKQPLEPAVMAKGSDEVNDLFQSPTRVFQHARNL